MNANGDTKYTFWNFVVAKLISDFVIDADNINGIKMLHRMPLKRDRSFIYLWQIFPKEEDFVNDSLPLRKSIYVNVWLGSSMKKLLYSGTLEDFKYDI